MCGKPLKPKQQFIMRKRLTLSATALLALAIGSADAQTNLVVTQSDGTTKQFALEKVRKLTFAESLLGVYDFQSAQAETFGLANVKTIWFVDATTGISAPTVQQPGSFRLSYADGFITATGLANGANAALYTTGGQKVMDIGQWDGSPLSVSALQGGVYILKVDNNTIKFVKR